MIIYTAGLGRSGTTIVTEYLANASNGWAVGEVANVFELGVLANELCQCGQAFWDCLFWKEVGRSAFRGWKVEASVRLVETLRDLDNFGDAYRGLCGLRSRHNKARIARYVDAHLRICRAVQAVTGLATILDSSKHAPVASWLIQAERDVHLLHLVRDSRAVASSWSRTVRRPESGDAVTYMDHFDLQASSRLWNRTNLLIEHLRLKTRRIVRLRYEDFCVEPGTSAATVFGFFGALGVTSRQPESRKVSHSHHAIGGNPVRFSGGTVDIHLDERWKTTMSPKRQQAVTLRTYPLLRHYNYPGFASA